MVEVLSADTCACRKYYPGMLGSMFVFVQDAADAVTSSNVETGNLVGFGDWCGQRAQRSGGADTAFSA